MTLDLTADVIDVRDIIAWYECLVASIEYCAEFSEVDPDEQEEAAGLKLVLAQLAGKGGDERWEGDWYPLTLIRDSYFKEYAMEYAEDIGAVPTEYTWPVSCIDWDQAARELQVDYSTVEIDGIDYWYR